MDAYSSTQTQTSATLDEGLRQHMLKVYNTMAVGLLLTFAAAWGVGSSPELLSFLRNPETLKPNALGWVVTFAPLVMVFFFAGASRMSAGAVRVLYYLFTAVMGLSLSWIFQAYTGLSIARVFLITAASFAGLSLWGYTTKRDISGWGSFLTMGLIGLILASIVNLFLGDSALNFAISVIGVLIFAAFTAYDTQTIKTTYLSHARSGDTEWLDKASTLAALSLYMDFINLFMMLLRLMGNRD